MAVARSSSDDNVMLSTSGLWMTSCVYTMGQIQIKAWSLPTERINIHRDSLGGAAILHTGGRSQLSSIVSLSKSERN